MTKDSQLVARKPDDLESSLRALPRENLLQMAKTALTRLATAQEKLSLPLVLLDDKVTAQTRFVEIEGALLKQTITIQSGLIVYDPLNLELVCCEPPNVTWDIQPCREGDLLDLQQVVKSGADQVQVRTWLKKLRAAEDAPQAPLEIKIVNAHQIGKIDKALKVSRDSDGKLTGATIMPIE